MPIKLSLKTLLCRIAVPLASCALVLAAAEGRADAQQVRVPDFVPSYWGLHFVNSFPQVPYLVNVAGTQVPLGNAANGMCGGMAFAARDYYETRSPIPSDASAPASGPLFDYLVTRLFDSFNLPGGLVRYLQLMHPDLPDHETWFSQVGLAPHGRAWIMINEEWPLIKADLDQGLPSPMALIKVKSLDPAQLGQNHQVLAYGYDLNGNQLTIHLYDPNYPNNNNVTLSLNIGDPSHTTPVSFSQGGSVFAFFRPGYTTATPPSLQDEYLVGDWNGSGKDSLAVRRGGCVFMDTNRDGQFDLQQCYGGGQGEDQYLVGDWDGDGRDNLAVRRGGCVLMDTNFDGAHDIEQCYGGGQSEDQYLVGDWDGDGRDNLAVRRSGCVLMDTNFDGGNDIEQCYGGGPSETEYLIGDWDGDGRDNLAVRRNSCVLMDTNFDGGNDIEQCYGGGGTEGEYFTGDWNGDGRDNLAVRRGNCTLMDVNYDDTHDLEQCVSAASTP